MEVAAPECLLKPLYVRQVKMLGPGPSDVSPRVLHAMSLPVLSPLHTEVHELLDEIKEGIKYVFQTNYPLTMAMSASGNGAMESALHSLSEPGETVLIAVNGNWSLRAADIAERTGAKVVRIEQEAGKVFSLQEIEDALIKYRPVLMFIVLGESSTGTLQPMEGMGDLLHRYDCLLVLDCVVSVGVVPIYTDAWGVDAVLGSSQKGLGCPPGLAPVAFSPRAEKKMKSRKSYGPCRYFDPIALGRYWGCYGPPRTYHHTIPVHLYYALREGLAQIAEEGLENVYERHRRCQGLLVEGLEKMGVELFVKDKEIRFSGVTTITGAGIDWQLVHDYILEKHDTELSLGVGPTAGHVLRIGLLAQNAQPYIVEHILRVLKDGLEYAKKQHNIKK